jgi:hypothetical protein
LWPDLSISILLNLFHQNLAGSVFWGGGKSAGAPVRVPHPSVPTGEDFPPIPEGTIALFGAQDLKELDRIAEVDDGRFASIGD